MSDLENGADRVRFYQTGTFTVGNRLIDPALRTVQAAPDRPNALTSGHRACQGCGQALGARYVLDAAMRATGGRLVTVNATGCLEVFTTASPESAWQVPWMHSVFGNAAPVAAGVAAALAVKGKQDIRVLAQGGDGGTADIGFGPLSGMFERNDDVLYVCYDNQGYMNTGVQRSSATPPTARTATTPALGAEPGNTFGQGKNLPALAMAHGIPYVATASVADLHDLEAKILRAIPMRGARYVHVDVPCPLGWGHAGDETIQVARLAVESGLFPLFEWQAGAITGRTQIRRRVSVDACLRLQRRFAHLFDGSEASGARLARLQGIADANIERFGLAGEETRP